MPKNKWAIAPSDLALVEGIFASAGRTGTPMFCWSEAADRWETYEADELVCYLDETGWVTA